MSKIAYVNGRYVLQRDAVVHIDDRGYQFADGVYEVCEVFRGGLIDEKRHFERLAYSLAELQIAAPLRPEALAAVVREVMARNRVQNGYIYVQVTRGVAPRDHVFPQKSVRPSLVVTARQVDPEKSMETAQGYQCHHHAGPALEAGRYQVDFFAAQRPRAPVSAGAGRL